MRDDLPTLQTYFRSTLAFSLNTTKLRKSSRIWQDRLPAFGTKQLEPAASLSRMPKRSALHLSIPASRESKERTVEGEHTNARLVSAENIPKLEIQKP